MSPEQVVAVLVAATGLVGALGVMLRQLHEMRGDLNGRLTELLDAVAKAERREGELAGRDYVHKELGSLRDTPIRKDVP